MARKRDAEGGEEEEFEAEAEGESEDDFADDEFAGDDDNIDFDSEESFEEAEFDEDADEEVVAPRPAAKRRPAPKKAPTIEGVPKTKLEKSDVAAEVWGRMMARFGERKAEPYTLARQLKADDVIEHKTFGTGFVIEISAPTKAEILFRDGLRKLVHSRS